jgi:hypothetical protein
MPSNNLRRADSAVRFSRAIETVAAAILIAVAFYGLGYLALIGPEIQEARMAEEERIERSQWSDHPNPNANKCGHNCIKRIPTEGETWNW